MYERNMVLIGRRSRLKMAIIEIVKDVEDMKKDETIFSHNYMAVKMNECEKYPTNKFLIFALIHLLLLLLLFMNLYKHKHIW